MATRIYLYVEPVDMRKGFEGLFRLVRDRMGHDPLSGHLFVFSNRDRTRLKALLWDGSGLWVCAKRLEKGRFGGEADSAQVALRSICCLKRSARSCSTGTVRRAKS